MLRKTLRNRNRKGQALAEYAVLIGGILLVTIVAVAILGHKINDMTSLTAVILPGAHADDNAPIISGKIIETTYNGTNIQLDVDTIVANSNTERLGNQLGVFGGTSSVSQLVLEP